MRQYRLRSIMALIAVIAVSLWVGCKSRARSGSRSIRRCVYGHAARQPDEPDWKNLYGHAALQVTAPARTLTRIPYPCSRQFIQGRNRS